MRSGTERLWNGPFQFFGRVPIDDDLQRSFKIRPRNLDLDTRAQARIFGVGFGFGFALDGGGNTGRDQALFERLGLRKGIEGGQGHGFHVCSLRQPTPNATAKKLLSQQRFVGHLEPV